MKNKVLFLGLGIFVGALVVYFVTKKRTEQNAIRKYISGEKDAPNTNQCQPGWTYDSGLQMCIEDAEEWTEPQV